MKKILFCLLIVSCRYAHAQLVVPAEVARQLQGDKSFFSYAKAMTGYINARKNQFAGDSVQNKYYSKQEKFLARQLWYLESRQDENGNIANSSLRNYTALNQYVAQRPPDNPDAAVSNGDWALVGPQNSVPTTNEPATGIGRADRIAFHPTDANTLYAGTPSGGIFKSVNAGLSWTNLNDYMPSLGVSGLVVSWNDPNIIYALTGDGDSNLGDNGFVQGFDYIRPSIGVLKSTDGGATWNMTGDFGINGFYVGFKLVQSPVNANILLAATSQGIYRTVNGGASWTKVTGTETFYDIEWKPGSSTRVYAASDDTFFISDNAGASWVDQNNNLDIPLGSCNRIALAVTPVNPSFVYLFGVVDDSTGFANRGVYRSTNSGDNFTRQSNDLSFISGTPTYMLCLAVAPDNVNIVLRSNLQIARSTNGAVNFSSSNQTDNASFSNYVHADVHDLAYNPLDNSLYVACDGGVYRSNDDGITYVPRYAGFSATQFYHFDISSADENYMLGGAQDNGGQYRSGNFSAFQKVAGGDGYDARFYNGSNTQAYLSINKNLYRSNATMTDFTWMSDLPQDWYKTIAMSYFNSDIVFASSDPVYRTSDGGNNWFNTGANGRWAMITCPSNGNRVYAAGGDSFNDQGTQAGKKMYRSDNQGVSWTELQDNPGFPVTITRITCIAVNPANASQVWVTMGGYINGQKVYYSSDAGANWQNLSGSLPNLPVNCITIDANQDAYLGTDVGVFFKSAAMSDWLPFYNGLPRVPVTEMHIRNSFIYAATFGRGIWKSQLHGGCPPVLNLTTVTGPRFYEAVVINAAGSVTGGAAAGIFLRAPDHIDLSVGFRADASTGAQFRAYIGNCGAGGIPVFRSAQINAWMDAHPGNHDLQVTLLEDKAEIKLNMQLDAGSSLVLLDENDKLTDVFFFNKPLRKGMTTVVVDGKMKLIGKKLVLLVDGEIAGVVKEEAGSKK